MLRNLISIMIIGGVLSASHSFGDEAIKIRYVSSFQADEKGNMFKTPKGVTCTNDSLLVIADTGNGRLLKYTNQNGLFVIGGEYRITGLSSPSKVQISSTGELFVLDEGEPRIARLSAAGEFVAYIKPTGQPDPGSFIPRSFALDARDNVYILDILAERVLVLDPAGKLLREVKFPKNYGFFSDLAVDQGGTVFLIDTVQCMVYSAGAQAQAFTALTGKLKEYLLFPTSITLDSAGLLYITDQNGGAILVTNPAGNVLGRQLGTGWKEGFLRYPSQVCITAAGDLFVADRENNRIQQFSIVK